MIKWICFFIFSSFAYASEPLQWSYVTVIKDQHEFYQNNEVIDKPRDAWQILFALHYVDGNFKNLKDCVFYKVPGNDLGILKIKTLPVQYSCEDHLLLPGTIERKDIKSLSYIINDKGLQIDFTLSDFKSERWEAEIQKRSVTETPKINTSSAAFKSSKIILLAPEQDIKVPEVKLLKNNDLCHNINEDCAEISPSICNQCPEGWYEIPNGCPQGPKYCGVLQCGHKNGPACRRGMKWQKEEVDFDCRTNSSFAYCSTGLAVSCEGRKAFCR